MKIKWIVLVVFLVVAVIASVMVVAAQKKCDAPVTGMGAKCGMATADKVGANCGMAAPGMTGGPMGMADCRAKLMEKLKLTKDQAKQLQQIRESFMEATKPSKEQIAMRMKDMRDLWAADTPDAGTIKALYGDIIGLRGNISDAAIDKAIEGLSVLTPKQRATLSEFAKNCPCPDGGACCVVGIECPIGMGPGGPGGPGKGPGCGMGGPGMQGGAGMMGAPGAACPMNK